MKTISQEELDWFVEDEMDENERNELFVRMDDDPDAWKRCALALLERDALRRALQRSSVEQETVHGVNSSAIVEKPAPASHYFSERKATWLAALAAMGLVAVFSLGYVFGGNRGVSQVSKQPSTNSDQASSNSVRKELSPFVKRMVNLDSSTIAQVNAAVARVNVPDQEVIAVVAVQHRNRQIILPVIQSEQLARSWAELPAPGFPAGLAKKIRDSGFALQPNRQFVSMQHKDGTNEVKAFNMLDCHFVGKNVF